MQRDKVNGGHLQPRGSTEDPDPGPVAFMGTANPTKTGNEKMSVSDLQ